MTACKQFFDHWLFVLVGPFWLGSSGKRSGMIPFFRSSGFEVLMQKKFQTGPTNAKQARRPFKRWPLALSLTLKRKITKLSSSNFCFTPRKPWHDAESHILDPTLSERFSALFLIRSFSMWWAKWLFWYQLNKLLDSTGQVNFVTYSICDYPWRR